MYWKYNIIVQLCSKTSVFFHLHVNRKVAVSKIFTLESVFEKMRFRDCFHRIRVDVRPNRRKNIRFQTKTDRIRIDGGLMRLSTVELINKM